MTPEQFWGMTGALAVLLTYLIAVLAGIRVAAGRRDKRTPIGMPRQRVMATEPDLVVLNRAYRQGRLSEAEYRRIRAELTGLEYVDEVAAAEAPPAPVPRQPTPRSRQRGGRHKADS